MKEPEREESEEEYVNERTTTTTTKTTTKTKRKRKKQRRKTTRRRRRRRAETLWPRWQPARRARVPKRDAVWFFVVTLQRRRGRRSTIHSRFTSPKRARTSSSQTNLIAQLKNFNKRLGKYIRQLNHLRQNVLFRRELFWTEKRQINDISMRNVCDEKQDTSFRHPILIT